MRRVPRESADMTIQQLREQLDRGKISSRELCLDALARIDDPAGGSRISSMSPDGRRGPARSYSTKLRRPLLMRQSSHVCAVPVR
jgi:hypothetical protein